MLSSFVDSIIDFWVAGFISLAIVLAAIRAYLLKLPIYLESSGLSTFLLVSLFISVCACTYLGLNRREYCSGDDQKDEELGLLEDAPTRPRRPIIHALPVIMDWGREDDATQRMSLDSKRIPKCQL